VVELTKAAAVLLLGLCFSLVLLPRIHRANAASGPRVIIVDYDGTGDFRTIQEAINNANTSVRDTIFVRIGTYRECVVVNKSVSIVGESVESTIVDGRPYGGSVLCVNGTGGGNRVSIENLTIVGSGNSSDDSGIRIVSSNDNNISRNCLVSNSNGISLIFSRNNRISYNSIISNMYSGFHLSSSSGNLISNNNVSGSVVGIYLEASNNNDITGNVVTTNIEGIDIGYGNDNIVHHNNLANANINAQAWPVNVTNSWDHNGEGNYWHDYRGHDVNGDGIGETSYHVPKPIGSYDEDRYPLMGWLSAFAIGFEGIEYEAFLISNSTISSFRFELGAETANRMIRFAASGTHGSTGFCRLAIPNGLMPSPHIVLIDSEEIIPKQLNVSDATYACIYFTYPNEGQTITVIYSEALHLYYEMLAEQLKLQADFATLNSTYYTLLYGYSLLLGNLSQTQQRFEALNASYSELYHLNQNLNETYNAILADYEALLESYSELQLSLSVLNVSYQALLALNASHYVLLRSYSLLLGNYSQLQSQFSGLGLSYNEHLKDYLEQAQNMRSLLYIFAATTAMLIATTVYLSKRAHSGKPRKKDETKT
jgi:parallel beta-helix repeat protein